MVALSMRHCFVATICLLAAVNALILLEDIDELTGKTWAAVTRMGAPILADMPRPPQHPLTPLQDIEKTMMAVNQLNKALAGKLNVPMRAIDIPSPSCNSIARSYVDFLTQTTRLLVLLLERKPNPFVLSDGTDDDYNVFAGISWMQALWASRTAWGNDQNLSFIEQRQTLYKATGCFPDMKDVLRRDVEVVELLNDLMDAYESENGGRQNLAK